MIPRLLVAWVALWVLVPVSAFGERDLTQRIRTLVAQVDARYARIKDFQADFVQETKIEGFETPLTSAGRVFIKKPGLLRWDYVEPSVEQIVVHNDKIDMFVPEHNQLLKGSLTMMVATKAPLQLLQGAGKLGEHFTILPTGEGELGKGGLPLLTLIPKNEQKDRPSPVTHIVSEIQPNTYFIERVSLHEMSGNISTFHFKNLKANKGLPDSVFELDLPQNVVIVEDVLPQ